MDATLLTVTASLAVYLPRRVLGFENGMEHLSMATTIGLSMGLFSLSILEATPSSWLLIVSHNDGTNPEDEGTEDKTHVLSISRLYYFVLWTLVLVILFIFPFLAGMSLADSFRDVWIRKLSDSNKADDDKRKKQISRRTKLWKSSPSWIRLTCGIVAIVIKNTQPLVQTLLSTCIGRTHHPSSVSSPTNLDLSWTRSQSTDELDLMGAESTRDLEFQDPTKTKTKGVYWNQSDHVWMVLGGLIGVVCVLVAAGSTGPLVVHSQGMSLLSVLVSWLCAIGLLISSLLNGFGSVSMPYNCLAGLYLTPIRPEVITKVELELQRIQEIMAGKRIELRDLTIEVKTAGLLPSHNSSSFRRNFGNLGDEMGNRRQALQREIDFLGSLIQDMKMDIEELRYSQIMSSAARTTTGKMKSYVGFAFSAILLVRLGSAMLGIWCRQSVEGTYHHKVAQGDIVTRGVAWLSGHDLISQKDLNMWSQIVSLGLTAILAFTQARTFFGAASVIQIRLTRLYRRSYCGKGRDDSLSLNASKQVGSLSGGLVSRIVSQILAGATGSYFLSCIVLVKMMLPDAFCQEFASALGGTDIFSIHSAVVNIVFAGSAGVSLSILGMLFGIQRQNTKRHTVDGGIQEYQLRGGESV